MKELEGDSVKAGKAWLALKKWSAEEIAVSYLTALRGMDDLRAILIKQTGIEHRDLREETEVS